MNRPSMRCAVWVGGDTIELHDRPIPDIAEDEILVSVSYAGICGSDIHILDGGLVAPGAGPPRILGHEFSGIVAGFGSAVSGFTEGEKIVAHPVCPCGECYFCRNAQENLCAHPYHTILRGPKSGCFAEYVVVKARQAYHLPQIVSLREAALVEPTAIAVHCMDRSGIRPGETVVILGGGAVGLLCLQMARLAGASTIVLSEPRETKRAVAARIGADIVVDPTTENLDEIVRECSDGLGADVCIEAVGLPATVQAGMGLVRRGGRLVILGWSPRESMVSIRPFQIYNDELEIRGSFFSPYAFQRAIRLLPRLDLSCLITHCFDLGEINEAIATVRRGQGIKVLVRPHPEPEGEETLSTCHSGMAGRGA